MFGNSQPQVWAVIGGQAGSEGKGKVAAQLAFERNPRYAVCAFSPNAGHTAYDREGVKHVFHQIPVGTLNPETIGVIGPGSLVDPKLLAKEVREFGLGPDRLKVDYRAWGISPADKDEEARTMNAISSTCQGVGVAMERRVSRHRGSADLSLFLDGRKWEEYFTDTTELLMGAYAAGETIQIEGSQGIDIDLIHGIQYPYCTSRSVLAGTVASDCGFPAGLVDRVVIVCRTYPIRVGNAFDKQGNQIGWSGPVPADSLELSWQDITQLSGSPEPLLERTTVTQKVRRIFTWSPSRFRRAVWLNGATDVYLNFVNYVDWRFNQATDGQAVPEEAWENLRRWAEHYELDLREIAALGTGPLNDQVLSPEYGYERVVD